MFKNNGFFGSFIAAIGFGTLILGVAAAIVALFGLLVMWLWNTCVVGTIVGVNPITFYKAIGLLILSILLFKGIPYQNNKNNS